MADERERILKMLEEGAITADEAKELLRALRASESEGPLEVAVEWLRKLGSRPLILTILAVLAVLAMAACAPFMFLLPGFVFWLIMLVDCLKREPDSFDGSITSSQRGDRLLWVAAIVFGFALGAVVYYILAWRSPARAPESAEAGGLAESGSPQAAPANTSA